MSDSKKIETTLAAPEDEREIRLGSDARRAAAIEAAYILEAVRR